LSFGASGGSATGERRVGASDARRGCPLPRLELVRRLRVRGGAAQPVEDGSELAAVHRHAVAEGDDLARRGSDACTGNDDADEVQRVGRGYDHRLGEVVVAAADGTEGVDGLGQRELLADEAG